MISNKNKYLNPFKNIYIIIFIVFVVWMLFFDMNSYFKHDSLNSEIEAIEIEKKYYQNEIEKDKKAIKELSTDEGIEKVARENYYMKKENEEIYIIEYQDSTAKQADNE